MKKIISFATILTVAAMVAGPGVSAATAAELQAQIDTLMATLASLQAQLNAAGGGTGVAPAACVGMTEFTVNLTVGSTGAAVKCLQAILNQSATTQVAASGAGSPGNETTYFGNLTKAAVVKYQTAHAIAPAAGYVGPLTRASLKSALAGGTPVTPGAAPVGCTSATEGSYTATLSASPVSRTVNGGPGIEAYGVDIKAVNSDISIGSVDLQATAVVGATAWAPGTFITGVKVYKDSVSDANLVKTYTSPGFTLDTAGLYYTSLTGLNLKVASGATTKMLLTIDTVESADNNRTVTLNIYGNGIRGRDCAGIDRFTALATTRVLTVQPASGNATLTLYLDTANPSSQNIYSDPSLGVSTDTPVLVFDAWAQSGNVTLTKLEIAYASDGALVASSAVPSILKLYDDANVLLASCTPAAREDGICTFENMRHPIAAGAIKKMTVSANWAAQTNTNSITFLPSIPATSVHSTFERSNGSVVNTTTAAAAIAGNTQYVMEAGVKLTLVGTSNPASTVGNETTVGTAGGSVTFTATPFGGTMEQITTASPGTDTANTVFVEAEWSSGSDLIASAFPGGVIITRTVSMTPASTLTPNQTGTLVATVNVSSDSPTYNGAIRVRVFGLRWVVGAADRYQGQRGASSGLITMGGGGNMLDNWATAYVPLQGR